MKLHFSHILLLSAPPEGEPASEADLDKLHLMMDITVWAFAICSSYRVIDCMITLYRALSNKVYEWFSICQPIAIGVWAVCSGFFALFVY